MNSVVPLKLKSRLLFPAIAIILAALEAWLQHGVTYDYELKHQWPDVVSILTPILFLYGIGVLLWVLIPQGRKGQALFGIGAALIVFDLLAGYERGGIVVGAILCMVGYSLATLKSRI